MRYLAHVHAWERSETHTKFLKEILKLGGLILKQILTLILLMCRIG